MISPHPSSSGTCPSAAHTVGPSFAWRKQRGRHYSPDPQVSTCPICSRCACSVRLPGVHRCPDGGLTESHARCEPPPSGSNVGFNAEPSNFLLHRQPTYHQGSPVIRPMRCCSISLCHIFRPVLHVYSSILFFVVACPCNISLIFTRYENTLDKRNIIFRVSRPGEDYLPSIIKDDARKSESREHIDTCEKK